MNSAGSRTHARGDQQNHERHRRDDLFVMNHRAAFTVFAH